MSVGISAHTREAADLDFKIGQMLMANFFGLHMTAHVEQLIGDEHLGGILLFENNFSTAVRPKESLQRLTAELQGAAATPLLIAMDHEGGAVNRLKQKYGFPPIASAEYLGDRNDTSLTRRTAGAIARSLSSVGINHNLAPVVDLRLNMNNPIAANKRCYSADPDIVIAHAAEFIRAHRQQKIITTLKHFPGHGSSSSDSHAGFSDVTASWDKKELRPYERLIDKGLVDSIMTAHIYHGKLDSVYPASISNAIITGVLRGKLGYDGVIISDDLLMAAIRERFSLEESVRQAVQAGNDILLFATTANDLLPRVKSIIKQQVETGAISRSRIDESYKRIARLKNRLA
ncbi:glycoside hydrolase family 3 [candidate division KSB1 bacterium]|nr:glycoside hydrolase family 3 [candidate division KSB1 bacterium]